MSTKTKTGPYLANTGRRRFLQIGAASLGTLAAGHLFGSEMTAMAGPASPTNAAQTAADTAQITVLYDAFGKPSDLKMDWGFAAYIEYGGKRILFDTGNNAEIFAHNVEVKGIDLTQLDYVVISHRHGDHTSGLNHVLEVNPDVPIYAPQENFGVFGAALPGDFYRQNEDLPAEQRYFDGETRETLEFGTPWPGANFKWIAETTEVEPGFHVIALLGTYGVDLDVIELSLAIDTPEGTVLVVGCSHPTIEAIVTAAGEAIDGPLHLVIGGTHLLPADDAEITRIAHTLRDDAEVAWIAPVHCTGEPAFEILQETFGERYLFAGLGSTLMLGERVRSLDPNGTEQTAMTEQERKTYRYLLATGHDADLSRMAHSGHGHSHRHHHGHHH